MTCPTDVERGQKRTDAQIGRSSESLPRIRKEPSGSRPDVDIPQPGLISTGQRIRYGGHVPRATGDPQNTRNGRRPTSLPKFTRLARAPSPQPRSSTRSRPGSRVPRGASSPFSLVSRGLFVLPTVKFVRHPLLPSTLLGRLYFCGAGTGRVGRHQGGGEGFSSSMGGEVSGHSVRKRLGFS